MKAKHGFTRSERKKHRTDLHENDINDSVSIPIFLIYAYIYIYVNLKLAVPKLFTWWFLFFELTLVK